MHEYEGKAYDKTGEGTVAGFFGSYPEDGKNEDEGEDDLNDQTCDCASVHSGKTV